MPEVVVCGAGIAGVSAAFHLTRMGIEDVVIVDPLPPLSLTSDKSTECYRNWWPSEAMVSLMGRSIDLLDDYARESGNVFGLNRRGYLYLTGDPQRLDDMRSSAEAASAAGAGALRVHRTASAGYQPAALQGFEDAPGGADLFLDGDTMRRQFPFLSDAIVGGLHARTAGWLSAQQLGMWFFEQALQAGASFVRAEIAGVHTSQGRVRGVALNGEGSIDSRALVNAAGPHLGHVGRMVGVELPVESEVHAKAAFRDHLGVFPREAPMIISSDPQRISWSAEEAALLRAEGRDELTDLMPPGCHGRPEGGDDSPWGLGLWEYQLDVREPEWPVPTDPLYPEVVLRGLAAVVPALAAYQERLPEVVVDAGYYTKTVENRPLACPVGPAGSYVCGALSGFGIMAACAVGELVAGSIAGFEPPAWAHWFDLRRYEDPAYARWAAGATDSGQL
ncbi:MAG: FAD-dependent oxidoreductase [Acidimicrobiia bacterium]|nr:FAD-dependent oxidoreductase [Acidimicrobiia bacterium]